MTRPSKRQCILPLAEDTTSPTGKRTIPNDPSPTINERNLQRIIGLLQDNKCITDLRADGSIVMTPMKSYYLPNEIIELILSHVSRPTLFHCTLASKRCYAVANPLLWKTPVFTDSTVTTFEKCMIRMPLERRYALGQYVETLDLYDPPYPINTNNLLPYMASLKYFAVDRSISMRAKDVALLPKHCPQLSSVRLHEVHLTESTFMNLGKHGQLTDFDWYVSCRQRPSYLIHLRPCPLRRLAIRFDRQFDPSVVPAILAFDQLTCLEIWTGYPLPNSILNPTGFPGLTTLRLCHCNDLTDAVLIALIETHPHLEHFNLRSASKLTDRALDAMHLLPLTHLTITENQQITVAAIRRLNNAIPRAQVNVVASDTLRPYGLFSEDSVWDR